MPRVHWLLWLPLGRLAQLCPWLVQRWVTMSLPSEPPHVGVHPRVVGLVQVQRGHQFLGMLSPQLDHADCGWMMHQAQTGWLQRPTVLWWHCHHPAMLFPSLFH